MRQRQVKISLFIKHAEAQIPAGNGGAKDSLTCLLVGGSDFKTFRGRNKVSDMQNNGRVITTARLQLHGTAQCNGEGTK